MGIRRCRLGRGVVARRTFRPRQVIGRVHGVLRPEREAVGVHPIDAGSGLCLDPDPPFRFLNHSCRPNAELVVFLPRAIRLPRIDVVALVGIPSGEELLIDYGWDADVAERCLCGENECRGWIVSQQEARRLRPKRDHFRQ